MTGRGHTLSRTAISYITILYITININVCDADIGHIRNSILYIYESYLWPYLLP